ncbi:MAG: fatty acid desaturase family protein [Planctomycetota bacterium]
MTDLPVPGRLNIALSLVAYATAAGLLWAASHAGSWPLVICAALAFSYVGNTIFSLLHESVHGIFHLDRRVNDTFGTVAAAFFPTGFTFQRVCHIGHHRRNRTDVELFDYYLPHESRLIKSWRLYSLLTGFYWLSIPTGCALFALGRDLLLAPWFRRRLAGPMGLDPMVGSLADAPVGRVRLEIAFTILLQVALFRLLDLTLVGWALCHAAFALNWCSLQYTDHAWTPRDIRNGASNLRVNRLVQAVFLNYHHHLAHHRNPRVPWIHLPRYVDFTEPRRSWLRTYLSLWKGPRPVREPAPGPVDAALERQLA